MRYGNLFSPVVRLSKQHQEQGEQQEHEEQQEEHEK
jgi:hypothetical protein